MSDSLEGALPDTEPQAQVLRHTVIAGPVRSDFLRDGPVAAQMLLTDGAAPRCVVAFVAGNSGAGVWFHAADRPVHWRAVGAARRIEAADPGGRLLRGIEADFEADAPCLRVRQVLLSSLRMLRDHQFDGRLPMAGLAAPVFGNHSGNNSASDSVSWSRDRLDGAAGYSLSLQAVGGEVEFLAADGVALRAPTAGGPLRLRLRALTGEAPLTPWREDELLNSHAANLPDARHSLLFLSYREKLLAGSWRFHTYFGRDTLMALRLLMPALQPAAIEAALCSVLLRLSPLGEVAHEEDIGEFPVFTRLQRGEAASAEPIFDYKMVDDDFMLLPVASAYVLGSAEGLARGPAFLAGAAGTAGSAGLADLAGAAATALCVGALLARNAAWVLEQAQSFAKRPDADTLVHLKPGEIVGDWRDSGDGLGGGVVSYSTNAVLVGAALRAIEALHLSGLLSPYVSPTLAAALPSAGAWAAVWEQHAPAFFEVVLPAAQARRAVQACADEMGIPAAPALASLASLDDAGLRFAALSLDAAGQPVPVMHSDFSFALLLTHPPSPMLEREVRNLMRPFPAGLMTDVGLLVANAAQAGASLRPLFGADRYHGAVVWSWQQAMAAAGLARQLARSDIPPATRAVLLQAEQQLWQVIADTRAVADSELWSWAWVGGRFEVRPFGPISATADESNAAQLWSTVYLGVRPPGERVP